MDRYFVTGIGTEIGKTFVAAVLTEALKADYWKPVQSGSLDRTDSHTVESLISNDRTVIHEEAYKLTTPMSPHAAAAIEDIQIDMDKIQRPETENDMVIEGAGGLLVPLNEKHTIADLIDPEDYVIVVSKGYLGNINHTLLTLQYLEDKGLNCIGVVYNQIELPGTIEIIEKIGDVPTLAVIEEEKEITKETVKRLAEIFAAKLPEL